MADQGQQTDSEKDWPPRFDDGFLARGAAVLVLLFGAVAWLVSEIVDPQSKDASGRSREAAAEVLFVVGVLALLLGAFFVLVEARKAVSVTIQQVGASRTLEGAVIPNVPIESVTKMAEAFNGRRVSAVLLAIGFTLVTFAAAGSGLVSISVETTPATSPAPTATPSP